MTTEKWKILNILQIKPIYEISNIGRVKNIKSGRILKLVKTHKDSDHYGVSLRLVDECDKWNGKRTFMVHRLVALMFIPNPLNKPVVHHRNGIATDNRVDNLMWVTYAEHQILTYELEQRNRKIGEENTNAKYTTTQYATVVNLLNENQKTVREISEISGVSIPMVREFIKGNIKWDSARINYIEGSYTQLQHPDKEKVEKAFQLIYLGRDSIETICFKTGLKRTLVSNIKNHRVGDNWAYLYKQYPIPYQTSSIIIKDYATTNRVISLAKCGKAPKEIIKALGLDNTKAMYAKVYRVYSQNKRARI